VAVCSADKLLGSIQAGLIFGKSSLVDPMRRNPLYRALRLDKVRMALLDHALKQHLSGDPQSLPTWSMLNAKGPELERCKQALALPGERTRWREVRWVTLQASVGGGSNPEVGFDSAGLRLVHREYSAGDLKASLARRPVPILGYVQGGAFYLDIRTFLPDDFSVLQEVLNELS
jgi:L-seryl-tRNA(Ser) seleniumtransferase